MQFKGVVPAWSWGGRGRAANEGSSRAAAPKWAICFPIIAPVYLKALRFFQRHCHPQMKLQRRARFFSRRGICGKKLFLGLAVRNWTLIANKRERATTKHLRNCNKANFLNLFSTKGVIFFITMLNSQFPSPERVKNISRWYFSIHRLSYNVL